MLKSEREKREKREYKEMMWIVEKLQLERKIPFVLEQGSKQILSSSRKGGARSKASVERVNE